MNIVKKFLLISSGADLEILERQECRIEQNRYVGIGATIFLTAVLASFSGGYALYTVFKSVYLSIIFGLFWGLIIFNLDRYIVSSMRKKRINPNLPFRTQVRLKLNELFIALPRLLLAFFIAVVITRPLELRLFEAEIEAQLASNISSEIVEAQSRINLEFSEVDDLNAQIGRMRQEIEEKERRREGLYQLYLDEMRGSQGSRTTGRASRGILAQERRRDYEQADAELQDLKRNNGEQINSINQRLSLLKNQKDARIETSTRSIQQATGLLSRMAAFNQLTTMSPTVAWTSYFLISLFILLETAPIIVKLLSERGPYDDIYDNLQSITYSKKHNTVVGVHDNDNGKQTHQSEDAKEKLATSRDESDETPIINATLLLRRDPYRLVGATFAGKYRLEHYAGGGGMGAVYYSLPTDSGNPVALKILKPDILNRNPSYAALFEREVKAAQRLEHPHIVKVLDNGTADDVSFMVGSV